jgi:chemotaxis protein histidine kinase CheA
MSDELSPVESVSPEVAQPTENAAPVETTEKVETHEVVEAKPEGEAPETKEKPKSRAQERIEELNAKYREEQRRAEALQARLDSLKSASAPDPQRYDDPTQFQVDTTKHAVREARAEELAAEIGEVRNSAETAKAAMWSEKVNANRERFPDFDAVVGAPDLTITKTMAECIQDSDLGPAVAYYLGKNPDEARRIAGLPAVQQGRELGRLEAKVTLPPPKRTSTAPPPAPVLAGGGAPISTTALADLPMDQFAERLLKSMGTR